MGRPSNGTDDWGRGLTTLTSKHEALHRTRRPKHTHTEGGRRGAKEHQCVRKSVCMPRMGGALLFGGVLHGDWVDFLSLYLPEDLTRVRSTQEAHIER